jgi:hypothetical protein
MTPGPFSPYRRRVIFAVLIVLALGAGLGSLLPTLLAPGKAEDEDKAKSALGPPSRVTVKDGVTVLTLSAADRQDSGIETARPSPSPAQEPVVGYGTVLDAAPLTELSNRYLEAESQVQTAGARLAVSRGAFERATLLYKDRQNISSAQLEGAQGSFEVDKAALEAARSRLTSVAASARQAWGSVLGAALIDRAPLMTRLIERADYLVKVTLPPGAAVARPPETAIARLNGATQMQLTFVSPATTIDPRVQGISYLYRAAAEAALLPGLNLEVRLLTEAVERGVVVPESAVVWLQGQAWIYLRTDPDTFVRREIALDRPGPDGGYIVTGLPADAEIAVRGAQMLLSEEFRAQVPIED